MNRLKNILYHLICFILFLFGLSFAGSYIIYSIDEFALNGLTFNFIKYIIFIVACFGIAFYAYDKSLNKDL